MSDPPADPAENKRAALYSAEVSSWMDQNFDQKVARQRSQADTAKLVTTFTLALAGTLVATALQVNSTPFGLCMAAVIMLGIAFLLTLAVIWLDQVVEPDAAWLVQRLSRPMIVEDVMEQLRDVEKKRDETNENWLKGVDMVMKAQLIVAGFSSLAAVAALLMTHGHAGG